MVKSGLNYSSVNIQNEICSTSGCKSDSLLNQLNQATLQSDYTKLAIPANSWLDDYFDWLNSGDCCRIHKNNTSQFCPSEDTNSTDCVSFPIQFIDDSNRPISSDFYRYLNFYLQDNPGIKCAKGGHAAYGEAIEIINNSTDKYEIGASFFMAYHSVGVTSTDFIESLRHANEISENVTRMMRENAKSYTNDPKIIESIEVFPYR